MPNHLASKESASVEVGPFQLAVLILVAVVLAAGDGLKIIPGADLYIHTAAFDYFHYAHGVLAIGVALLAALYLSPVFGWIFLAVFFLAHAPYFFLPSLPASMNF